MGISDQTYYTWKKGVAQPAITTDDQRPAYDDELDELEAENRRLRKLLSEKLRTENADLRKRLGLKDA
ncbi:transposase [Rhizobium pusense]|uniref:transposase n=1 Tax=Agrobacterium pusense TaxID=648995 RepID=UPI0010AEE677|nr:transposase [Agrobacterium pusense]MDH2089153.1 transposase [Agrobacterium pusense]WCK27304.1 transposase [Agrobacterium pusense]